MSLPRKIMEECRLYPAKLWSNADFAPQNNGARKSQSLHTLPLEIMEQCRLCPAKSETHSFRGKNNIKNYPKTRLCVMVP